VRDDGDVAEVVAGRDGDRRGRGLRGDGHG
jgi:hypothetical protein